MQSIGLAHFAISAKLALRLLGGAGALLGILSVLVGRIAYSAYRIVANEFTPAPAAAILSHPEQTRVAGLGEVSFRSADGLQLAGWYVPSHNGAAIVLCHGTNADRSSMLPEIRILAEAGFGVLAFDWPGEGRSEGQIHWNATERNALTAAVDFVAGRAEVQHGRLGVLGFSMGGLITTQVAARDSRLQAVVLEAAPSDFAEYAKWSNRRWGFFSAAMGRLAIRHAQMPVTELPPISVIGEIAPRPLLVVGGADDVVVPPDMTRRLYAAATSPKSLWIVPGAGHGHYAEAAPAEYGHRLVSFFSSHLHHIDGRG